MLLQPKTKKAFDTFTLQGIIIPHGEKPGHSYQKENLQKGLQKEATVLGVSPSHHKGSTRENIMHRPGLQLYNTPGGIFHFLSCLLPG